MSVWYKLDEKGEPTPTDDINEALVYYHEPIGQVAYTPVGKYEVSTAFLPTPVNGNFFETYIMGADHPPYEFRWWYKTRKEALVGHNKVVEELKTKGLKNLKPDG